MIVFFFIFGEFAVFTKALPRPVYQRKIIFTGYAFINYLFAAVLPYLQAIFNIFKKFLNLIATAIFRRNRLNYRYRNLSAQGEFFKLLPGKYLY